MKKIFLTLALILSAVSTAFAYQIQAGTQTQRLERGTKIGLEMAESVTSTDFETGDMFSATIREDVNIDKNIILPKGSLIRGSVGKIVPSKRLSRAANLSLTFKKPISYVVYCALGAIYIVYLHRENIKRLVKGEENKVRQWF